ncbi:hypothetical protein [Aerosakkonema funiforme]|uniref:Uncharacterized protein n=2 Tax=Oscillatoriophycideae TaxID=1301283 RepID=A0A926VKS4_9CYAN|nr:hypothetical protein [Aerosakkonema funiforme]MBD2185732.1 hypothetical protein [Aerosakkonema funiforme FACHB-1375]
MEIDSGAICIKHTVCRYPSEILFGGFPPSSEILDRIEEIGFLPTANPADIVRPKDSPIRWQASVIGILIWSLLWLKDIDFFNLIDKLIEYKPDLFPFTIAFSMFLFINIYNAKQKETPWYIVIWQSLLTGIGLWIFIFLAETGILKAYKPGFFASLALFLAFSVPVLIRYSDFLQELIIKQGRHIQEAGDSFSFPASVSGVLLICLSAYNFGGYNLSFWAFILGLILLFLLPVARAYYLGGK